MTTVLPQRTAAPVVSPAHLPARRHNLVLRAALLGLFAAPILPAVAQNAAINAAQSSAGGFGVAMMCCAICFMRALPDVA